MQSSKTQGLTYADWLEAPEQDGLYEILAGELILTPSLTLSHQRIMGELLFAIDSHLRLSSRGKVFPVRTSVRLSNEDIVQPDIVVVLAEHYDRLEELCIGGPPDLVAEILSPESAERDRGAERALYERSGIPEYWIVDPKATTVQVLALVGNTYREAALYRRGDTLRSALLPGLEIPVYEIF